MDYPHEAYFTSAQPPYHHFPVGITPLTPSGSAGSENFTTSPQVSLPIATTCRHSPMYLYMMRLCQTRFSLTCLVPFPPQPTLLAPSFCWTGRLTQLLLRTPSSSVPATNSTKALTHMLQNSTPHLPFLGLLPLRTNVLLSIIVNSIRNMV
jgi:hypothetical protein